MAAKKTPTKNNASPQSVSPASSPAVSTSPAKPVATPTPTATPTAAANPTPVVAPVAIAATPAPTTTPTATTQLIAKLHHLDADIARDAATTLGTLPANTDSLNALAAVLFNKNHFFHPVVRAAAATSLGKLRDPRALDALLHATRDPMAETSDEAVKALGLLKDKRALPTLQTILKNPDNFFLPNVQKSAQLALTQLTTG